MEVTATDIAYRKLLSEDVPHAIRSDREHKRYLERVETLLDKPKRSAAEDRYLELLVVLIERYEGETEPIDPPDPLEALKELMAANGMTQADLSRLLGSSGIASEVLSGKRALSKTHIRKLAARFHVHAGLFV